MISFSQVSAWAVLAAVTASQVVAQLPPNCDRTYTVVDNDTCDGISAAHNASTFQLAHFNPGVNALCTNIFADETLCLGTAGHDCSTTAVVQPGDFCSLIADNAGIDVNTLLANNPNVVSDCSNIYVGEVLCTASLVYSYP